MIPCCESVLISLNLHAGSGVQPKTEPHFGAVYWKDALPDKLIAQWASGEPSEKLVIPSTSTIDPSPLLLCVGSYLILFTHPLTRSIHKKSPSPCPPPLSHSSHSLLSPLPFLSPYISLLSPHSLHSPTVPYPPLPLPFSLLLLPPPSPRIFPATVTPPPFYLSLPMIASSSQEQIHPRELGPRFRRAKNDSKSS